jgi:hypothetical protein
MFNDEQLAHAEIVQKETEDALGWWKGRALKAEAERDALTSRLAETESLLEQARLAIRDQTEDLFVLEEANKTFGGGHAAILRRAQEAERDAVELRDRLARAEEALRCCARELTYVAEVEPVGGALLAHTGEGDACVALAERLLGPMRDWPLEDAMAQEILAALAAGEKEAPATMPLDVRDGEWKP